MRLIDYNVLPLKLEELVHTGSHTLERRQTHIKLARLQAILQNVFPLGLCCDQVEHTDLRAPLSELELPV